MIFHFVNAKFFDPHLFSSLSIEMVIVIVNYLMADSESPLSRICGGLVLLTSRQETMQAMSRLQ